MAQYDLSIPTAFAGLKADSGDDRVESYAASETISFGRAVAASGTDPVNVVDLCDSTAQTFRGISLHIHNEAGYYASTDTVAVLRQGVVWVDATNATIDTTANVLISGGLGKFTTVAASNLATPCVFRSSADGVTTTLAKVEINLP
jgi:hypothetical protein